MLSKKIFFENYLAYGLKDEKWKYYVGTTLSLTPKTIYEFPVKYLKVSYQYDSKIPGQMLRFVQEDNILLSFKRGVNDKRFFNNTLKIEHLNEFDNHFSYTLGYEFSHVEHAGTLCFNYIDYSLQQNDKSTINTSELFLGLRYAPHEQFYQRKTYRAPIKNNYPVFELQYHLGNDVLGNDYNFKLFRIDLVKRYTYLDHPHVTGTGLRVRFKVDF